MSFGTGFHAKEKRNDHPKGATLMPKDSKYSELDEFLGDWGKHLVKEYGLSAKDAMDLALEAAELYAHDTRDGWCCACDADITFMMSHIQDEPEFIALINKEKAKALKAEKDNYADQ